MLYQGSKSEGSWYLYINTMNDSTFAFNVTRNRLQGHEVTAGADAHLLTQLHPGGHKPCLPDASAARTRPPSIARKRSRRGGNRTRTGSRACCHPSVCDGQKPASARCSGRTRTLHCPVLVKGTRHCCGRVRQLGTPSGSTACTPTLWPCPKVETPPRRGKQQNPAAPGLHPEFLPRDRQTQAPRVQ